MPELPEVETVRRDLDAAVVGRRVASVRIGPRGARSIRRYGPPTGAVGLSIKSVQRRGKYLVLDLSGDRRAALVVHLRMSGQLLLAPPGSEDAPHTHVVFGFADGGDELRFVDPRTFGEVFLSAENDAAEFNLAELAGLGPDALAVADAPAAVLRSLLAGRRVRAKAWLVDQRRIAGIGNIYSDEILHRARIRYDRPVGGLSVPAIARLHEAIGTVLHEAVDLRGSSLSDRQYVDLAGVTGRFQERHLVYDREGLACLTCAAAVIRRTPFQQRSTYSCPRCQR